MYLAPLNYDRYFKKVFSDMAIAKRFLEDFLDISIETIELLKEYHKITDDATAVEFDFRCKINGRFVVIDMQQWYKPDIVQRFYVYHCINTALQLEKIPQKSFAFEGEKERKIKDYSEILPVITLIWMVEENFGFTDDYVAYTMTSEIVHEFIEDHLLWNNPDVTRLLSHREAALKQLTNKTKRIEFLKQNRLIYAFQKNIVKNQKYAKYYKWFELAEKTRNRLNEKADFLKYYEDEILTKLMQRISKEVLSEEDFTYIDNYEQHIERVKRLERGIYNEGREEGREEERKEQEKKEYQGKLELAKKGIKAGYTNEIIATMTDLTSNEIDNIRKELEDKK